MPFRSKRSIAGFSNVQKKANNENTCAEKTYTKRPFQERDTEILESPLRSGTEKKTQNQKLNREHAVLFETPNLGSMLNQVACPECKSKGTICFISTSLSGISTYYDLVCSVCAFESRGNQSCSNSTNQKLALGTKLLGLQKTQVEKLFLLLGFAFYVSPKLNPTKCLPYSVNLQSQLSLSIPWLTSRTRNCMRPAPLYTALVGLQSFREIPTEAIMVE